MDWLPWVAGIVIGGIITLLVTHVYARRQEKSLARLPEQVAQTLIPRLVERGLIEQGKETEARAVTQEVLSSSWGLTQAEMNQASMRDFKEAEAELQTVYERLRSHIGPEERQLLAKAQEAWKTFQEKEVRFAGALYKGGSIQPLIHNSAALGLTRERLADLTRTYNYRRSITVPFDERQSEAQ
jgi:uncharacterized protein YecT (DUF1311 family)